MAFKVALARAWTPPVAPWVDLLGARLRTSAQSIFDNSGPNGDQPTPTGSNQGKPRNIAPNPDNMVEDIVPDPTWSFEGKRLVSGDHPARQKVARLSIGTTETGKIQVTTFRTRL